MCAGTAGLQGLPAAGLPPLTPAVVETGLRLHAHATVLRTLQWGPYTDGDYCDTCKLVVLEAASILADVVCHALCLLCRGVQTPLKHGECSIHVC